MKIAELTSLIESVPPASKNGLEFIVSYLTGELIRRGHEITLFATQDSKTRAKLNPLFPVGISRDENNFWDPPLYANWNSSYALSRLKNFDLIHSHTSAIFKFAPFSLKPIIYTAHNPPEASFEYYCSRPKYKNFCSYLNLCIQKLQWVFVSRHQKDSFLKSYAKIKKYSVVHNGIPVEKFEFNAKPKDYFLYLGYINKDKGADLAVRIARKAKIKLMLAGDYSDQKFFNKNIKPFLNDKVKYLGSVGFRQKNDLLKNAKALLFPIQWDEPFGLAMVEAMACGTPVVGLNRASVPEVVLPNKTGFIAKNIFEMAADLKKIGLIKREACRNHVEQNFSLKKMADGYEKIYNRLI